MYIVCKTRKGQIETWACLFNCIATRTIYNELPEDMIPEQFSSSFRQFIRRRAKPDETCFRQCTPFQICE